MGVVRLADLPAEWSRQHQILGLPAQLPVATAPSPKAAPPLAVLAAAPVATKPVAVAPLPMAIAMIDTESRLHLGRLRSGQHPAPGRRGAGRSLTSEEPARFFCRRCTQASCAVTSAAVVAVAHIKFITGSLNCSQR
jgi:hypothetical protein